MLEKAHLARALLTPMSEKTTNMRIKINNKSPTNIMARRLSAVKPKTKGRRPTRSL